MKKMFFEKLPQKKGCEINKDRFVVDWVSSVGYKVDFIYNEIQGNVLIIGYDVKKEVIKIEYQNKEFYIKPYEFKDCRLGRVLGVLTKEFKIEIGETFKDEYRDIVIIGRETFKRIEKDKTIRNVKRYKYRCNRCGWVDWKEEHRILNPSRCSNCYRVGRNNLIEGVNDVATIYPEMIKYFQGGYDEARKYSIGTNQKIYPICPDCGKISEKGLRVSDICLRRSIGCYCGDGRSYGEKFMYNVLEQMDLNVNREVKFDWCIFSNFRGKKKMRSGYYDFVIEDFKLIIEIDGDFHYIDNKMNGQTKEESEYIDNIKDKLAKENGYKVIRIKYSTSNRDELKNNITNSEISKIFDLSKINWKKCEGYAMGNLARVVCDYWNLKKEGESAVTIASLFNISDMCVRSYLKKGTELGWCKYNPKEELIKAGVKSSAKNDKKVEILKDGVSLGIYNSTLELVNNSEEKFGYKLNKTCISSVALGKSSHHRGYTFRYV